MRPALLSSLAVVLGVLLSASAQAKNPYLEPAARLYQNMEFHEALKTIDRGLAFAGTTPDEEVQAALLEGVITAQLGKTERAVGAFKRALAMKPDSELPFRVSPKIGKLLDQARKELGMDPKKAAAAPSTAPPKTPAAAPKPADEPKATAAVATPAQAPEPPKAEVSPKPAVSAKPESPAAKPTVTVVATSEKAPESKPSEYRIVSAHPDGNQPVEGAAKDAPEAARASGAVAGASFLLDAIGSSAGAELFGGYHIGGVELSARVRPGTQTGVGLLAGYEMALGPVALLLGLRGDVYLDSGIFGGGAVLSFRRKLVAGLRLNAGFSLEGMATAEKEFQSLAGVVSLGLDWRQ